MDYDPDDLMTPGQVAELRGVDAGYTAGTDWAALLNDLDPAQLLALVHA